ncbi:membrane protein [gut metagenome]|uniref:Membrane protein n=1 Tax=gut metagenome TaxID=749906 RepID=J9CQ65_9ZZZZ
MVDVFSGKHFAHIGSAGGIADHGSTTTDKGYGLVSGHLKAFHKSKSHKVTCGKAVSSAVKANIEFSFAVIYHFPYFFLICHLSDKSTLYQLFVDFHLLFSCPFIFLIVFSVSSVP